MSIFRPRSVERILDRAVPPHRTSKDMGPRS
jgi:hypothetical protein